MRFLLLMWSATDATGGDEADLQAWVDFEAEARDAGVYVDSGAFRSPRESRLVRTSIGGDELPDAEEPGTFADGDVQAAAFYLVECPDRDTAVDWANRLPTYGLVEVRELIEY